MSALERYQDRLNIFSAWLDLHELESADVHVAEVATLATNNAAGSQTTDDLTKQLESLTVSNPPAAQSEDMQTVHSLYNTAPNQPTPKVNL